MKAYYFAIYEYNQLTCQTGIIVLEGIIGNAEDNIYPAQETDINKLPHECEAHHFSHPDYKLIGFDIKLTREDCLKRKI